MSDDHAREPEVYLIRPLGNHASGQVEWVYRDLTMAKAFIEDYTLKQINALKKWEEWADEWPWYFEWAEEKSDFGSEPMTYYSYYAWQEVTEGKYLYISERGKMCFADITKMSISGEAARDE